MAERQSPQLGKNRNANGRSTPNEKSQAVPVIRVGTEYQAPIKPFNPELEKKPSDLPELALCIWKPPEKLTEEQIEEYVNVGREKYGYNLEQCLGLLSFHEHDVEKALAEMSKYMPLPDEWSLPDKVMFEEAFQQHGKMFQRIKHVLPDKSMRALICHYYLWKKSRARSSYMDMKQQRKLRNEGVDDEFNFDDDADEDDAQHRRAGKKAATSSSQCCSNCNSPVLQPQKHDPPLCNSCLLYQRRYGKMRTCTSSANTSNYGKPQKQLVDAERTAKGQACPKGLDATVEELAEFLRLQKHGEEILEKLDVEVKKLKSQACMNAGFIASMKSRIVGTQRTTVQTVGIMQRYGVKNQLHIDGKEIERIRRVLDAVTASQAVKNQALICASGKGKKGKQAVWTAEEKLLAIQGFRRYGVDCETISKILVTKTAADILDFYYREKTELNLEQVIAERTRQLEEVKKRGSVEVVTVDD